MQEFSNMCIRIVMIIVTISYKQEIAHDAKYVFKSKIEVTYLAGDYGLHTCLVEDTLWKHSSQFHE